MGVEISVVIPTYNEEESVLILYEELNTVLTSMNTSREIVFVDDGSTDHTFQTLKEIHQRDPTVRIVKFRSNFGQSAAMKAGFDHTSGHIIVTMDADLQNDPHDIPALVTKMHADDLDVVCGWRYNRQDPFFKRIFSKIANSIRIFLTNELIHDSGCTLRAYKKECMQDLELYGELHRYIPAMLLWKGYRVGEIKTNHRDRSYGWSKYSWIRLIKGFLDLLVITFWQRYSARPMHVFGGAGLVMGTMGILISLYLGIERILLGVSLSNRPLFLVALVFLIVGVQFIALGIIADILVRIYYGQNQRKSYLVDKVIE